MRDNMLVNISGLKGHSMAIDINMEHLIGQLKVNCLFYIDYLYQHSNPSSGITFG